MAWNYLSIPKIQWLRRWSLWMHRQFHFIPNFMMDVTLSMLGLKLVHISKEDSRIAYTNKDIKLNERKEYSLSALVKIMTCSLSGAERSPKNCPLQWRHNERGSVSNHQRLHSLLNCRFRRRSKKASKLRVTGLCGGNSPANGEFPAQKASNAEHVSIWWRHHGFMIPSSIILWDDVQ